MYIYNIKLTVQYKVLILNIKQITFNIFHAYTRTQSLKINIQYTVIENKELIIIHSVL